MRKRRGLLASAPNFRDILVSFPSKTRSIDSVPDLYADLEIPVAVDRVFTYLVPDELHQTARCGMRALAPFGRRTLTGVIMRLGPSPGGSPKGSVAGSTPEGGVKKDLTVRYKYIRELLDLEPLVTDDLLNLSRWIAKYY